jgi:hypothetical protein
MLWFGNKKRKITEKTVKTNHAENPANATPLITVGKWAKPSAVHRGIDPKLSTRRTGSTTRWRPADALPQRSVYERSD